MLRYYGIYIFFQHNCTGDSNGGEDGEDDGEEDAPAATAAAGDNEDKINECEKTLASLETIDDELDDIGIILVTTEDLEIAAENGKLE